MLLKKGNGIVALIAALSAIAPAARAQTEVARPGSSPRAGAIAPDSPGAIPDRPTVTARRASQAPTIDGRLDDAVWRTAALIDTFVQEEPQEGQPATEKTEVRVAYDSEKVYIGIYAHYSDPGLVRANRSDRDKLDNDDTVTIFIEPFLDYLRGYSFSVNGYGVQRDSMIVVTNAQDTPDGDTTWNALFTTGGARSTTAGPPKWPSQSRASGIRGRKDLRYRRVSQRLWQDEFRHADSAAGIRGLEGLDRRR